MPAFATPTIFHTSTLRKCALKHHTPQCNLQNPSHNHQVPSTTRRRLLQAAALAPFSLLAPVKCETLQNRVLRKDRLYDARSGSFVPASAVGTLMRRDVGNTFDRCIVAGEIHDNVCTHAAQLAVIENARQLPDGMPLTVGFEQFYRAHDAILDDYVQGRMSLTRMLKATKWEDTWGFDPKLYSPIFEYCRVHRIPMVGLNVPYAFVQQVGAYGFDGLADNLKELLPDDIDLHNEGHFKHFMSLMGWDESKTYSEVHKTSGPHGVSVERYYQAQVLWEEWMSQSVAMSLNQRPGTRIVALIGSGHVEGRYGFPDRIEKRCQQRPYTIVPRPVAWDFNQGLGMPSIARPDVDIADLVWYTRRVIDLV